MIPIETLFLFLAASVALSLSPGPDNIFVLTQSAMHGRRAGFLVVLGLCSGLLVHTAAVSMGIAVIFQKSAIAFNILKIIGASYLLYLAWKAFKARPEELDVSENKSESWSRLYARGVVMNITNPKVAIFFIAFLPQFADPAQGSIAIQMLMFGGVFAVATIGVFGFIAWAASFIGVWLKQSHRAQVLLNRIAGGVFVALALRLALSQK